REDERDIGNARALVAHLHDEELRGAVALQRELDLASARVAIGVAGDLRNGRRDARLVLTVEAEVARDLTRALPRDDHVLFVPERDSQQGIGHSRAIL